MSLPVPPQPDPPPVSGGLAYADPHAPHPGFADASDSDALAQRTDNSGEVGAPVESQDPDVTVVGEE